MTEDLVLVFLEAEEIELLLEVVALEMAGVEAVVEVLEEVVEEEFEERAVGGEVGVASEPVVKAGVEVRSVTKMV